MRLQPSQPTQFKRQEVRMKQARAERDSEMLRLQKLMEELQKRKALQTQVQV